MKKAVAFVFISFFLSGCLNSKVNIKETNEEAVNIKSESVPLYDDIYNLYIKNENYILSMYEPKEGHYIGAYILTDKNADKNIENFEKLSEKEHLNYIYHMVLGEPFPINWVLECISFSKMPYIVIEAPNLYSPFQYEFLESTAKEFGKFNIPVFVQFYPNPQQNNFDSEKYKDFFIKAREEFKKYAPNVAFIWSVDLDGVYDNEFYYPGNEYTDWVGLNIYIPIDSSGKMKSIKNEIDYFYYMYQKDKPIMISQLGISHFTTRGHKYYTYEATNEIKKLYSLILEQYPRIKAVNYMSFNNFDISPQSSISDNFSITDNKTVLSAYKEAVKNENYIGNLYVPQLNEKSNEIIKSPFCAYKINEEFYISENTILYDLNLDIDNNEFYNKKLTLGNSIFYNLQDIEKKFSLKFDINENKKEIIIY